METLPAELTNMPPDESFLIRNGFTEREREGCVLATAAGGHMAYQRFILRFADGSPSLFIKAHDTSLFTDEERATHSQAYLQKEARIYEYLADQGYDHIPDYTELLPEGHLAMEALDAEEWLWRAPRDAAATALYVEDTLAALDKLQETPLPQPNGYDSEHFFPKRIMKVLMEEGWAYVARGRRLTSVRERLQAWNGYFHPEFRESAQRLYSNVHNLIPIGCSLYDVPQQMYFSHHDARQANVGWHPNLGVKLVDWSWADVGFKNTDATMFLIDMTKSGHDVTPYLNTYFNPDHALLLIGHWLGRSIEPTRDGDPTVRFHQAASAVVAYSLLNKLTKEF